ncbi:MAG: YceI family protein [Bdellovibrionales bacterium]|nr:YceI family protein [Bdellovibrionales bacterium]
MKLLSFLFTIATLSTAFSASAAEVNVAKSKVIWKGSKIIGSFHTGEVKVQSAKIDYKDGAPVSGQVVVDMTSIVNKDLTDKKMNQKLIGHLKSDDFFGVEKYKTATLDLEKIQKASDKFYLLTGKLTIKGKALPVTLKAEVKKETKSEQVVQVAFNFDRTKYDIKYGSGSFFTDLGDKMISDEVQMNVELHIKK